MTRVVRKQTLKTRRLYGVICILFLLAAAGAGLYRYPPSLLDIGRIFRQAADKILGASADLGSAEPVLRGTIYDRTFRELAVSYPLYSLYVRPGEVADPTAVVEAVASATGTRQAGLEGRLKKAHNAIKVADNLEPAQVKDLVAKPLAGLHVKQVEERFYPGHEAAASLIGYTGDNIGLAGAEGAYDMFLQHGEFRSESLPEINFQGREVMGRSTVDAVLTLDLVLQKELERQLQEYLRAKQAGRGLAICLEVKTGAVRAWVERPAYNPNYYWQMVDATGAGIFQEPLDPSLYRNLLVRAAALTRNGELGDPLPPDTVAAVDYGLQEDDIRQFGELIGMEGGSGSWLPLPAVAGAQDDQGQGKSGKAPAAGVNALQFARAAASLVNGGWYVAPHVLAGIYDHEEQELFSRSAEFDSAARRRTVSPAMGIRLRRDLFGEGVAAAAQKVAVENASVEESMNILSASAARMAVATEGNGNVLQDLLLSVIPAKAPTLLLLMVAQREELYPLVKSAATGSDLEVPLARKMLPALLAATREQSAAGPPATKDPANYSQFLISRRMDFQDRPVTAGAAEEKMPEVTGLSLRKGLQRLNPYHLLVNIEGTGRIIRQNPPAGTLLQGVGECNLTLDSKR